MTPIPVSSPPHNGAVSIPHNSEAAAGKEVRAEDVGPARLTAGLPRVHANAIGARAEALASHNSLLTRWASYRVATEVLTHEVGPRVSPERSRGFERMAASALLLP